jgi:hypothetical protein
MVAAEPVHEQNTGQHQEDGQRPNSKRERLAASVVADILGS